MVSLPLKLMKLSAENIKLLLSKMVNYPVMLYQNQLADLINCSEVHSNCCKRVGLFYANFSLERFDFSNDFYALDFLRFA